MLKEFQNVRQDSASGHRRLFVDDKYELYVWYTDSSCTTTTGFQLVYFDGDEQKAYTWLKGVGSKMATVDGWDSNRFNRTPLLVADGLPNLPFLLSEMEIELEKVEAGIADLVKGVLKRDLLA